MGIFRLAGELFLIYLLYKLVFDFVIPLFLATKKVKKQFSEMHTKMQEQVNKMNQQANAGSAAKATPVNPTPKKEDYIDYEEVK